MNRRSNTAAALVLASMALIAAAPRALYAFAGWAAFDRGGTCEAVSRSARLVADPASQPRATFMFDRAGSRRGQLAVQLSRAIRPDATVLLTIGDQPFLLVARDRFAWSRGPAQESAIIAATRFAPGMRIEARSPGGGRFVDSYALAGAAGAIDAAAACSARRS